MTGVYVATSEPVGAPDDVLELQLSSIDSSCQVLVLARVARVVRQDDPHRGARVIGAAFEFLPADETPAGVAELLAHCARLELGSTGSLMFDDEIRGVLRVDGAESGCSVRSFGPDWLNLTTAIDVDLVPSNRLQVAISEVRPTLDGTVLSVLDVELPAAGTPTHGLLRRVRMQVDASQRQLLLELAQHALLTRAATKVPAGSTDLAGQLQHLPLASLVGLLERGRYSGVLCAGDGDSFFSFEIEQGRVSSWVRPAGVDANQALPNALSLRDGEFKFHARSGLHETVECVSPRLLRDLDRASFAPPIG
jgi:hypothetical protein